MAQRTILNKKISKSIKKFLLLLKEKEVEFSSAILFGSWAKGTANNDSDIDIAIVSNKFGRNSISEMMHLRNISMLVDSQIEPIPISPEGLKDSYSTFSEEIRNYGIPII